MYGGSNVVIKKHEYQRVIRWNNNGKGVSVNPFLEPVKYLKKKWLNRLLKIAYGKYVHILELIVKNNLKFPVVLTSSIYYYFFLNFSVPTLGQIQNNYHPGYVPSSKPHLPTLSGTYSRPQASETFKVHC